MLRGPCPHSLSWPELILQNKTGRVGKVWGRKYPSVSPFYWPLLLTYAHMTEWRVGVIIGHYTRLMTDSFHVAWSDVSSPHNVHIPLCLMYDQYSEMSQQRDNKIWWTEIIGLKIMHWLVFSSRAWQYIIFLSESRILWIIIPHPRHYNIYLSGWSQDYGVWAHCDMKGGAVFREMM